ncbi:hypothetical protein TWF506_010694 [Arthrobotrys conoides]|uniref:glucan 1,3-beta-glucosidase n=1 Tax=Arthrobotrys conoides TaxID=74498 RepID=A0AAN8NEB0_9PEZI
MASTDIRMESLTPPSTGTPDKLAAAGMHPTSAAKKSRRKIWIGITAIISLAAIAGIVIAVLISQKVIRVGSSSSSNNISEPAATSQAAETTNGSGGNNNNGNNSPQPSKTDSGSATNTSPGSSSPTKSNAPDDEDEDKGDEPEIVCPSPSDIPKSSKGTYYDPTSWLTLEGFNCTFTTSTVGSLPLIGLNSSYSNTARANPQVPPLSKPWGSYVTRPARGVNLGGWLSLEPFITPSLFEYPRSASIYDEYGLTLHLGPEKAAKVLEEHYATFITEADFRDIAAAGLDHVRIPFSYWAVETYEGDPYVSQISWRYLLRGIEWARKYGLRIKLDLHGLPGSQNSWNHSGRQGKVNWLTGPDGPANAERSLKIHDKLSKFFAQERYKNIIAFYGLANEPGRDHDINLLIQWTQAAYKIVKDNGIDASQVMSDSLRGLGEWHGRMTGLGDSMVLDGHEYVIFDNALLSKTHTEKIEFACKIWVDQITGSMNTATGFGPTMVGEWSQADTDCTQHLNGISNGARWTGTFFNGAPSCPTGDKQCSCDLANADPKDMSPEYKLFLKTWAEAQMDAFEKSWGWFYWTWKTESAPLWSYKAGLEGGIMPEKAYERDWHCDKPIPSFGKLSEIL